MSDDHRTTTPKSRTGRFFKLAGMTASVASQYAAGKARQAFSSQHQRAAQQSKAYEKMAENIVGTLGELKGAVMKVGQIASQTQDFLPAEFSQALQKLQKEAPPMAYEVIRAQIIQELGKPPEQLYAWFDEAPFGAASIGQVHRARTHDGLEVIVKVQYPGVDESCDSDLKQLRLALKLGGLIKLPKETVDKLFDELRARLHEELDYENEAANIRDFHRFHLEDLDLLIPQVVDELTSRRVLTMEYLAGDHIAEVENNAAYTQDVINRIGARLFKALADQLFKFERIHGDPHAGNFAFRTDGTVIMYDFGCVKRLKPQVVQSYRQSVLSALNEDYSALDQHLQGLGVRVPEKPPVDPSYYARWRDIFIKPFASEDEPYDFAQADIHQQVAANASSVFKYWDSFQPPVESLFIDRMIAGHYWIMKRLGVQAAFRGRLNAYLGVSSVK